MVSLRDRGTVGPELESIGVPTHAVGIRGAVPGPAEIMRARSLLADGCPTIVHGWMYHGAAASSILGPTLHQRPTILWNVRHSLDALSEEKPTTGAMIRLLARGSSAAYKVVYNSRLAAAQHERLGYEASRTVVIPNGFDTDLFRPSPESRKDLRSALGIGPDEVVIAMVGRWHVVKDHSLFLRAFQRVAAGHRHVRAVLAGRGVDWGNDALMRELEDLGVADRVSLLGEIPDPERVYRAADVLCNTSRAEGFSNVIGEAMACAIPCVATRVGDSDWIVGDTGSVVPRSVDAVAAGLDRIVRLEPDERTALGLRARERIVSKFSIERMVSAYQGLYERCAEGP